MHFRGPRGRAWDFATLLALTTLALPKQGLRPAGVEALVGELYLADISVPPDLNASSALDPSLGPLFHRADVIRLR